MTSFINRKDIYEWETYQRDTLPTELKGVLPNGKPLFQMLFEKYNKNKEGFPTIIQDCDTHIIIVPGGYNPRDPCYEQLNSTINRTNPPSVRLGGKSSLMSL